MQEAQIIKQLKAYRFVSPDKGWAVSAKKEILEGSVCHSVHEHRWNWALFHRPSFLVGAGAMAVLAFFVLIGMWGNGSGPADYEVAALTNSLKNLEASLAEASNNLKIASFNITSHPDEALVMQAQVQETIEQGEGIISQAKRKASQIAEDKKSAEVLSVLTAVEQALENMKEANKQAEKQAVEREIASLEQMVLSERQKELLEWAKASLAESDYQNALMAIIELSQN